MDADTLSFIVFLMFSLTTLTLGYVARKRGWLAESCSRPIHYHTMTWIWSSVAVLSIWRMPIDPSMAWLLVIVPTMVIVPAFVSIPLAQWWFNHNRNDVGVMVISAGVSNCGPTLGAFLCYVMLDSPVTARGLAIAYVTIMSAFAILVLYPMAQHFSPRESGVAMSLPRLFFKSFFCLPALLMYAAVVGVLLSIYQVPFPIWIDEWDIIKILFYAAAFGGYLGVGLRLHLDKPLQYIRHHLFLVFIRFMFAPLLAWVMVMIIQQTPWPLDRVVVRTVILESYMPAAVFCVMVSNLFDLDARLASVTWLGNTLIFVVLPLPILLWLV